MKRPIRNPFLVWWNEVAPNHEGASRFALAHLAWEAAKHDARKRRKRTASMKNEHHSKGTI